MAITLNANALTTTAEAMAVTGITDPDLANRLINAASDFFEQRCNRKFTLTDEVEDVPGYGTDKLRVSRWPVVSVASITDDGSAVDITDLYIDDDAGLLQLPGGFGWTAMYDGNAIGMPGLPGTELPLYQVTYRGGWITPQNDLNAASPFDGAARNMPYDLEEAVNTLVKHRYGTRVAPVRDPTIKSEKLRTWAATYGGAGDGSSSGDGLAGLPAQVREAIIYYRRCV